MKPKKLMKCLCKFIYNRGYRMEKLSQRGFGRLYSDKKYLKTVFYHRMNKKLDLENPQTFNEKLQWLKLYDRKPLYTTLVDKYAVKEHITKTIGEDYVIPCLGVWDNFEDIDFDSLPDQFVLKCTHDSGGLVICRDKSKLDYKKVQSKIRKSLKRNYYWFAREWPYKDVKPRIIAEKFMKDRDFDNLNVFKIFNFNGEPKIIQTIQNDKMPNETIDYFDTDWNLLDFKQNYPNSQNPLPRPKTLTEMLDLARTLAKDTSPFIRTDFYEINGKVYFSEFTFYSDAGFAKFTPEEWGYTFGSWIRLNNENS